MMHTGGNGLRCIIVLLLVACTRRPAPPRPITHDAYVWQRRWTPALRESLWDARQLVRAWRILSAQIGDAPAPILSGVDFDAVRHSGRPVVIVLRIDGQYGHWDDRQVTETARTLIERFRRAGVRILGVEIDYDCANRRLQAYATFLRGFRKELTPLGPLKLSITLLPAWLGDAGVADVMGNVDEVVLQTHSVLSPERGLFDLGLARSWVAALAALKPLSFRVALPTYGHRISFDAEGSVVAIESESPRGLGGMKSRELFASPDLISQFMGDLRKDPPPAFAGFAWFRLPTREDRRAWSLGTWKAVIQGSLVGTVAIRAVATDTPGAFNLLVINPTAVDREMPRAFEVMNSKGCDAADATRNYRLDLTPPRFRFSLEEPALLAPNERRIVGWVRCSEEVEIDVHAE